MIKPSGKYPPVALMIDAILGACRSAGRVLDVGAGLEAPYQFGLQRRVRELVLLDGHAEYLAANQTVGPNVRRIVGHLPEALAERSLTFDVVLCIDVIEHLDDAAAEKLVSEMKRVGDKVCVFTPDGESPQDHDAYMMGADDLQTHRSVWSVEKLQRLGFEAQVLHPDFHGKGHGALWAVWKSDWRAA